MVALSPEVKEWCERLHAAGLAVSREAVARICETVSFRTFEDFVRHLEQLGQLTHWQAQQLLAGRPRFLIGKYRLLGTLGRGGMGEVFLAEHVTMERRVAIKLIDPRLPPPALERFFNEVRIIAALDHPNIVHAYNVDLENGQYYLVMEYVEGVDLEQLVRKEGPLPWRRAVGLVRQAAAALGYAHDKGVVHCDIKPANLMVTPQDVVKILDLGLARLRNSPAGQSSETAVVGTIDYMAPELALQPESVDGRVDIYSLGCVLFFLLVGKPPFPEGSLSERIVKHQTAPPPDLKKLRPDVPEELNLLYRKCLAKLPGERFQTAEELARALKACLDLASPGLVRAKALPVATPIEPEEPSVPSVASGQGQNPIADQAKTLLAGDQRTSSLKSEPETFPIFPAFLKNSLFRVAIILFVALGIGGLLILISSQVGGPSTSEGPKKPSQSEGVSTQTDSSAPPQRGPEDDPEEFRRRIEQWMRSQAVKQNKSGLRSAKEKTGQESRK